MLHAGVGGITESDVTLAGASGAPIIGFNVRPNAKAREIAERQGVAMQYYDVIYDLTDAVKAAMAGELGPLIVETVVGRAEVREVFSAGKHGKAAGLLVTEGFIRKALKARITRDDVIVYNGTIASLGASRTTSPKCAPASNAASPSKAIPTSRPATSWRPTRSRSASGRFEREREFA